MRLLEVFSQWGLLHTWNSLFIKSQMSFPCQQFVPFRDYMDRTGNHVLSMARLAKDVLAEIPDQLISYMKSRAIKPNPVPPAYSSGDHLQTNPVWAPTHSSALGVGQGRDWWDPPAPEPSFGKMEMFSRPFHNINLAKQKDGETPFCFGAIRLLLGKLLMIMEFFLSECLRMRALGGARCRRKVLVVRCQTCQSGDVMDSK